MKKYDEMGVAELSNELDRHGLRVIPSSSRESSFVAKNAKDEELTCKGCWMGAAREVLKIVAPQGRSHADRVLAMDLRFDYGSGLCWIVQPGGYRTKEGAARVLIKKVDKCIEEALETHPVLRFFQEAEQPQTAWTDGCHIHWQVWDASFQDKSGHVDGDTLEDACEDWLGRFADE